MASLPYPRTPLSSTLVPLFPTLAPLLPHACTPLSPRLHLSFFRFTLFFSLVHPISFPLHTPYFCHPHRPTRMLVTVDADARNGRRRCSHRPAQMLVSTDADARIDRRRCSYRPTRMIFVDVSQCQTFTFTKRSVQLVYGRAINIKNISPSTPLALQ